MIASFSSPFTWGRCMPIHLSLGIHMTEHHRHALPVHPICNKQYHDRISSSDLSAGQHFPPHRRTLEVRLEWEVESTTVTHFQCRLMGYFPANALTHSATVPPTFSREWSSHEKNPHIPLNYLHEVTWWNCEFYRLSYLTLAWMTCV